MKIDSPKRVGSIANHIPDQRSHLQRDFAWVSNRSEMDSYSRRVAERYRAACQGARVRKGVRVETIAKNVIQVRLRGDRALFERVGLSAAFEARDARHHVQELVYVAIDGRRYSGKVLTDPHGELVNLAELSGGQAATWTRGGTGACVCINGGFFNHLRLACADTIEAASIGKSISDGLARPSLPLPPDYADDYCQLAFEDGSCIEVAPRLSENGKPLVTDESLSAPKYDVQRTASALRPEIRPGHLQHAASRHPRAAISRPPAHVELGTTRLIVGLARHRNSNPDAGYSLAQWAKITSRLDRLSPVPNTSLNLDGGGSVALLVVGPDGTRRCVAQYPNGRPVANALVFVERPIDINR